jgi:hypothetical protein
MMEALIAREESRPRDPLLPKLTAGCNLGRKYTFGWRHAVAARGDARPPRFCPFGARSDRWPREQGHSMASPDRRPRTCRAVAWQRRKRGRSNCFPT